MAVEFMDHAASAYIAADKGWYEDEGLDLTAYESYATGMALASALARGDIQVAYLCLVPAITAYANAGVQIKIVAGTHKDGYSLMVNPDKVKTVNDLENEGLRIGCVQEGGAVDVVLHKAIEVYQLDSAKVMANIQRMNPQKMALAIKSGQLDAAFLPGQWGPLTESFGFEMLVSSRDILPDMQGSVLVVKTDLLNEKPEAIEKLVKVSQKATDWITDNPADAAEAVARQLNSTGIDIFPIETKDQVSQLVITPEVIRRSMAEMTFTTDIDLEQIQATIDYMVELGYISSSFPAEEIVDLRFLD